MRGYFLTVFVSKLALIVAVFSFVDSLEDGIRILGGSPCSRPYQVSLTIHMSGGNRKTLCGGSLIAPGVVLTAAHCTQNVSFMEIGFGSPNRSQPLVKVNSTGIKAHPKWNSTELTYDCALVTYDASKVRIDGSRVATIRLPATSQKNNSFVGDLSEVSGWGRMRDFGGKPAEQLQCLNGSIIANSACSNFYPGKIQDAEHICMKGRWQKSTCNGDSGGPLTIADKDGRPTQVGIVSFGMSFGCGWSWPGVFARVTSCQDWILQTVRISRRP